MLAPLNCPLCSHMCVKQTNIAAMVTHAHVVPLNLQLVLTGARWAVLGGEHCETIGSLGA